MQPENQIPTNEISTYTKPEVQELGDLMKFTLGGSVEEFELTYGGSLLNF